MTEEQQQEQQQETTQAKPQQRQESPQQETATVPSHRLREETQKRQEAEKRLSEIENERAQHEEKQAKEQGEWQQVAEKRQQKVQTLEEELNSLKAQVTRDARHRAFSRAAQGVLLTEAVDDAFEMLSEEDLKDASLEDENSWTALSQRIAERKPYLADGHRGTGSGGSNRPVLTAQSTNGRGKSAIADMKDKTNKRQFK